MKHLFVVNRFHLKEKSDRIIGKLERAAKAGGMEYEIVLHDTLEDANAFAKTIQNTESVITAIGGDGYVNRLLNQVAGTKNVLSFIPYGTGNDSYRACTEHLPDGFHEVDMVRINDRYFINAACFGIDADIANDERFIHNRMIPRPMRFNAGVLYHFLAYRRGRKLKVQWDEETVEKEFTTVVAANSNYYVGGYRISPESDIRDGRMEVYLVDALPKVNMARTILSIKKAGHLQNPALRLIRTGKLTISADKPFGANIDGEELIGDRFELEIIPKGMRLFFDHRFIEQINRES
ncbi:MAG: hypothetical protein J5935_05310 [Lachnospiraceae bacterium]|nr:hypothetical protein [Lachnospiraceae bacterium]